MTFKEAVTELTKRQTLAIKQLRNGGTVAMSKDNLMAMVSSNGIYLPNANAYSRAFDDALAALPRSLRSFVMDKD